jgi:hypothetical protein
MTATVLQEMTIVAGMSTFHVRVSTGFSDRSMKVTITLDGRMEWTSDQAAWRPLASGCGSGIPYLWSARALIVLPTQLRANLEVLEVDEDLLLVFRVGASWLLVCETCVRLLAGQDETSRVEFGDVVEQAIWDGNNLVVQDARGITKRIEVKGGSLICQVLCHGPRRSSQRPGHVQASVQ